MMKPGRLIPLFALLVLAMSLQGASPEGTSAPAAPAVKSLAKATPAQIKAFFKSAAYTAQHRSDVEFINDAYQGILRRVPDPKGLADWKAALKNSPSNSEAREHLIETFLGSDEYREQHPESGAARVGKKNITRNPPNVIFNQTGVFLNDASAFRTIPSAISRSRSAAASAVSLSFRFPPHCFTAASACGLESPP
jgi:hypothetical protein